MVSGKKNLVGLWCNLFRAIEIAKTGNYTVSVYHDPLEYENAFDDYKSIKTFCKGFFDNFVSDGDIKVEIVKPQSYEIKGKYEALGDISLRVEKFLQFPKPELILCSSCDALLKNATDKLDLSLNQVEKVKQIAVTIAQMDFSKTIQPHHIAESIQYQYKHNKTYCNPESQFDIVFGDMIYIKRGAIDKKTIHSAINYLKGLT